MTLSAPVAATLAPDLVDWPAALSMREWDHLFPGILDFVGVMAGAANVIMQLSHPAVGYGVVESRVDSGALFRHPVKRARTTFTYLGVALLGTADEKQAYRQAVSRAHAQVYSTPSSPVPYNAFRPDLQLWVAACLYQGVVDVLQRFRGPLSPQQAERLYQLAQPLGTTLQVRPDMWPPTREAFEHYWQQQLQGMQIDDTIRTFLTALIDLKFLHPLLRSLFGPFNRFVSSGFLPAHLRQEMQLPWSAQQQRRFDYMVAVIATINRFLPRVLRQAPTALVMWDFRRRLRKGMALV